MTSLRKLIALLPLAIVSCALVTGTALRAQPAQSPAAEADQLVRDNFEFAAKQYAYLLKTFSDAGEKERLPRTFVNGKAVNVRPRDWTSGFFPGGLWFLYEYTKDNTWRDAARDYTGRLESLQDYTGTHDLGFMINCSYGNGLRLTGDPAYRAIMLRGADALATRYNPAAGVIRSWDHGAWTFPVIIDNMMNLEFLMWASRETHNPRYAEMSIRHAHTTLAHHFREDGSSFHLVDYDPLTGDILTRQTVQGYANWSAWARGQAWGLYGYTAMYRDTGNPIYLKQAQKIASFILTHSRLPEDKVPYWDFDAPNIPNAPRDASAAAIMASAFLELSDYVDPEVAKNYVATAKQQLLTLSSPAFRAKVGENGGFLLMHCTGHLPKNSEVDVPLNYADYYFLEALLRYRTKMAGERLYPEAVAATQAGPSQVRHMSVRTGPGPDFLPGKADANIVIDESETILLNGEKVTENNLVAKLREIKKAKGESPDGLSVNIRAESNQHEVVDRITAACREAGISRLTVGAVVKERRVMMVGDGAAGSPPSPGRIDATITIDASGAISLDGQKVSDSELRSKLAEMKTAKGDQPKGFGVRIFAEPNAQKATQRVMEVCRQVGITRYMVESRRIEGDSPPPPDMLLSKPPPTGNPPAKYDLTVNVDKAGAISIDGKTVTKQELATKLRQLQAAKEKTPEHSSVQIFVDAAAPENAGRQVIDACREANIMRISLRQGP